MLADFDLVDKIRKDKQTIVVTFSTLGTKLYSSKEILQAIASTEFRSTIKMIDGRYQIRLIVQPTMEVIDWLTNLKQFVQELEKIRNEHEMQDEKE